MTDEGARQLPIKLDAHTLHSFGSSTWMTDAGPIDVLRDLRDRDGGDVSFDLLLRRGADQEIGGVVLHIAGLDDIIAAKEYAGRDKDREALQLGLARTANLRRALERERFESSSSVTLDALARLASLTADLDDPGVMSDAWS
jgi:hypothetical protein